MPQRLPRLLYLADVPVESTYHGSALLYRLLEGYPADKLLILEPAWATANPTRALANVCYRQLRGGIPRLMHSRFARPYGAMALFRALKMHRKVAEISATFRPEAVLTVAHGFSWLTAAMFAKRHRLPLHLILHDDWLSSVVAPCWIKGWMSRRFARFYSSATSRLCVSPAMAQEYRNRYRVSGAVLYPSRGGARNETNILPGRGAERGLTFAYAGTLTQHGYADALQLLAEVLEERGGELLIFGPLNQTQAAKLKLTAENIRLEGSLPSTELIEQLRERAAVLFLPMAFGAAERVNMTFSFPSKLSDYTATGLPLLIVGPDYCSAVRWAKDNPGVAEVVEQLDLHKLGAAVDRLAASAAYREELGARAQVVGDAQFSQMHAQAALHAALASSVHED